VKSPFWAWLNHHFATELTIFLGEISMKPRFPQWFRHFRFAASRPTWRPRRAARSAQAVYDSILARSAQAAGFTFDGNKREPRSSDGKSLEENGDVLGDTIDETMVLLW